MGTEISYSDNLLAGRGLLLVSDRGPVEHSVGPDGRVTIGRGRGGLVTALSTATKFKKVCWIASAKNEIERQLAQRTKADGVLTPLPESDLKLRYVLPPPHTYDKFYNVVCNRLWFLQHQMSNEEDTGEADLGFRHAWEKGYVPVNQVFAEAAVEEARKPSLLPIIMVQDIHLYLTTPHIRRQLPEAVIEHFVHIPWPAPSNWKQLPDYARLPILEGLLRADIVGLQTERDVRNFLDCCRNVVSVSHVDYAKSEVVFDNRSTRVKAYPASIDLETLQDAVKSPEMKRHEQRLLSLCGEKTLVRVDRVEPTKNISRGFRAFSMLLEQHSDMVGSVNFLAFLVPSPSDIPEYIRCQEEIDYEVQAINSRFGRNDWQPVTVFYGHNYHQALAGLRLYDVLLVNPIADGMNLVAKEGPMLNRRDGVLVLSKSAGAYDQLKEGAISINPDDLEMTRDALYQALTMGEQERELRAADLRRTIEQEDAGKWFTRQIHDLQAVLNFRL